MTLTSTGGASNVAGAVADKAGAAVVKVEDVGVTCAVFVEGEGEDG